MATKKTKTETPKRGRGRPASFPGQKTTNFLTTIPTETRELLRALKAKRGSNMNQVIDAAIRQMARKSKISISQD